MFSVLLSPKLSGIKGDMVTYRQTKIQPKPNPSLAVGSPVYPLLQEGQPNKELG